MKRLRRIILLCVIASLTITNAFAAKKQKTIKLGFNIPLTGDSNSQKIKKINDTSTIST